jgi:glycosyltransferase involved in cell wall biosynthesis
MTAPLAFSPRGALAARSSAGLAGLPTIVALGPFDDLAHAGQLAAAFSTVRRRSQAQLVLLGTGAQRATIMRQTFASGVRTSVRAVDDCSADQWQEVIAAADVVVPSTASGRTRLLEVLAAGRPVVAPLNPTTVRLIVPTSAGFVYRPGDVSGMAGALLRLLTMPSLHHGMSSRAREVARQQHLQRIRLHRSDEGREHA